MQKLFFKKSTTAKKRMLFPIITVASLTALAALQLYFFPPEEIRSSKPVIQTANSSENKNEINLSLSETIVLSCKKEMVPAFDSFFRLHYETKIYDCHLSNLSKNSIPHSALIRLQNEGIFTSRGKI